MKATGVVTCEMHGTDLSVYCIAEWHYWQVLRIMH